MGIIYKVTSPSGKVYVGQTIQRFEARITSHRSKGSRCTAVSRAIQKYGDKMVWDIIEEVPNELLDERENFWIKELNCLSPNGYNLVSGGGVNRIVSQVTKDKLSTIQRERVISKNGYEGSVKVVHFGFYPRVKVNGKEELLSDGVCKTMEEAEKVLKEYTRDPENFVKPKGSGKVVANGHVSFNKTSKTWQVYDNTHKYLCTCKTKEEGKEILKEYLKDPENFVKPSKTKRKNGTGSIRLDKRLNKWVVKGPGDKYLGVYETKEEAEEILKEYLKDPENFVKPGKIRRKKGTGGIRLDKRLNKWVVKGTGGKYLGVYETKEKAETVLEKYNISLGKALLS